MSGREMAGIYAWTTEPLWVSKMGCSFSNAFPNIPVVKWAMKKGSLVVEGIFWDERLPGYVGIISWIITV